MNTVLLKVSNLCSCKEPRIHHALCRMGIESAACTQEGTVSMTYDPQSHFFIELIELIEEQGCTVQGLAASKRG
jgi:hypothetical protein